MAGRHRRPVDRSGLYRRLVTGAVASCLSLSLFGVAAMAKTVEPKNVPVASPVTKVTPEPIPPLIIEPVPTTSPEPTPEPVVTTTTEPPPEPEPEPVDPISLLDTYPDSGFGGVEPHVARAGYLISDLFGIDVSDIGGVGKRSNPSEHPEGLALDFMVYDDHDKGDEIAQYALDNFDELDVKYVIWQQSINEGSGWERMGDRGGVTQNHEDHVHVSFNPKEL